MLATADGQLTSLDPATGVPHWREQLTESVAVQVAAVASASGLVVATTAMAEVIVVAADTGEQLWRTQVTGPAGSLLLAPPATRVVTGQPSNDPSETTATATVLVSPTWTGPLLAFDGHSGELRWERSGGRRWVATPDHAVVAVAGALEAWDLRDGSTRWRQEVSAEPVDHVGGLIVIRDAAELRWLDPDDGTPHGAVPVGGSWWAAGPQDTLLVSQADDEMVTIRAVQRDQPDRWAITWPSDPNAGPSRGCCVEVTTVPDGRVVTIDRRGAGVDLVLAGEDGSVVADLRSALTAEERWAVAAVGDLAVLQGDGALSARSLRTGALQWRIPGAAFLVSLDPVVVATRQQVLAPRPGPAPGGAVGVNPRLAPTLIPTATR